MIELGSALSEAIIETLPGFIAECITRTASQADGAVDSARELIDAATVQCMSEIGPLLQDLLTRDMDAQWTTPLSLVRRAVGYASAVLESLGVPHAARDAFTAERFPEDPYGLNPTSLYALGDRVGDLAVSWGAAKAFEHRRRHGSSPDL